MACNMLKASDGRPKEQIKFSKKKKKNKKKEKISEYKVLKKPKR
jgi:hypothetical protein